MPSSTPLGVAATHSMPPRRSKVGPFGKLRVAAPFGSSSATAGTTPNDHGGTGWLEMLKNWITLKAPVLDASNEYQAAGHLKTHGLNTLEVAAYGRTGWNPAQRRSFLITDEIAPVVSLEQFCLPWLQTPPPVRLKRDLLQRVAEIARTMHAAGVNHRDFYICHLLLTQPDRTPQDIPPIFVVDLHRAQLRRRVPRRWLIRDLAALCFSSPRHRLDPTRCVSFFETLLRPGAGARSWARKQRCSTSSTTARTGCMPKPNEKAFLPGRSPPAVQPSSKRL